MVFNVIVIAEIARIDIFLFYFMIFTIFIIRSFFLLHFLKMSMGLLINRFSYIPIPLLYVTYEKIECLTYALST